MAYVEKTTTSYGKRLKDSLSGIGMGFVMLIAGIVLLFWNEGRTVKTTRMLKEAQKICVDVPDISVANPENNGKVIHAIDVAKTDEVLTDPYFRISANAIKLSREVEYYQVVEHSKTETRDKIGGGEETITTYTVKFADLLSPDQDPKGTTGRPEITELDSKAMPGHQYDLNVVVYGLQEIKVTVSLQEWVDSGNFVVDQDEDQAIAINIADLDDNSQPNYGKGTLANPLAMTVGGADYPITATTVPENQTLTYSSSNGAVATVSESGLIHAVAAGDAKIIITAAPTDKQPEGGYRVIRVRVTGSGPAPAPVPVVFTPVGVDFDNVVMTFGDSKDISTLFTLSDGYTGTLTYAITAGNEGDYFTLAGSNLTITGADDGLAHTVTVTVTAPADNGNNFSETTQAIVFNVAAN